MSGIKYNAQINMSVPPTEANHVVRKKELDKKQDSFTVDAKNRLMPITLFCKDINGFYQREDGVGDWVMATLPQGGCRMVNIGIIGGYE